MTLSDRLRSLAASLGLGGPPPPAADERTPAERAARREFLRRSLDENLETAAAAGELGPGGRAQYLVEHLEIYVHRLHGFAANFPSDALLTGDFFAMVEIGAEATGRELHASSAPAEVLAAIHDIETAMDSVRPRCDLETIDALLARTVRLRELVSAERA